MGGVSERRAMAFARSGWVTKSREPKLYGHSRTKVRTAQAAPWFWRTELPALLATVLLLFNFLSLFVNTIYARRAISTTCEVVNMTLSQLGGVRQPCTGAVVDIEPLAALLHLYPYRAGAIEAGARADWWVPWPNNLEGRLGWYRQGLREVEKGRSYIRSLATEEVPAILIAAAIANQGNSPQRPFGWAGLERLQRWLGLRFEWRFAVWEWAQARWRNYFERPSVGIAQIQPDEAVRLVYAGDRIDLFDDRVSIALMQAKLVRAAELLAPLNVNATDRFALIALSNNDNSDGERLLAQIEAVNGDLFQLLVQEEPLRRQLARMMTYVEYLHTHDDWMLPDAINVERLWWYIESAETDAGR